MFIEASDGVWTYMRGEPGPRMLAEPVAIHNGGAGETVVPGEERYFDGVLDTFSTSCLIRTVTEFEPTLFSSLLMVDQMWDVLPRPQSPADAALA